MDIRSLIESSESIKQVFDDLEKRDRFRRETTLSVYKDKLSRKGIKIDDKELFGIFKALESAGAGTLVYGRRGMQTRFVWGYDMRRVAIAAKAGTDLKSLTALPPMRRRKLVAVGTRMAPKTAISNKVEPKTDTKVLTNVNVTLNLARISQLDLVALLDLIKDYT